MLLRQEPTGTDINRRVYMSEVFLGRYRGMDLSGCLRRKQMGWEFTVERTTFSFQHPYAVNKSIFYACCFWSKAQSEMNKLSFEITLYSFVKL